MIGFAIIIILVAALGIFISTGVNHVVSSDGNQYQNLSEESHRDILKRRPSKKPVMLTMSYVTTTDDPDGRMLYGRPLETQEDWERWWVLKGLSEGYLRRLSEIEKAFNDHSHQNPTALLSEWKQRYGAYKTLCAQHGMWNSLLEDHVPYVPTALQLQKEKTLLQSIENRYSVCMAERALYLQYKEQITAYLNEQSGHKVTYDQLIKHFCPQNTEKRKQFKKIFAQLVKNRVFSDRKNKEGIRWIKKSQVRSDPNKKIKRLPASQFDSKQYLNVDKKMLYKVEHSVASPLEIDRTSNTCSFISISSGEKYLTSLNECTCPAYNPLSRQACKHMLALALYLRCFTKFDVINGQIPASTHSPQRTTIHMDDHIASIKTQAKKEVTAKEPAGQKKENITVAKPKSMVSASSTYTPLIKYLKSKNQEFVDKSPKGGALYFFSQAAADHATDLGYKVSYAPNGTKGTGHRPAWYVRLPE